MRNHVCSILVLFLFAVVSPVLSQDYVAERIQQFTDHTKNHPVEKIYLHLDKPYYVAGEYMYYRAYLTDLDLIQGYVGSRIIYVELSDERKKIVKRSLLYSDKNEFAGQIQLPDTLASANYHLRAYTNWMRNVGEDHFYHRDIYIGHQSEMKKTKDKEFDFAVSFFPEGGQLLYDLNNRVAFKAVGNDGYGTNISGVLRDEAGQEVLQFRSTHLGMGSFSFTPDRNKTYMAEVTSNDKTNTFTLPKATEGMTISLSQTEDSVYIHLKSTRERVKSVSLVAQSRHTVCYALEGVWRKKEEVVVLPKTKFPTGIAQFTLFEEGHPVSERLLFINRHDQLQITITPDKEKYTDRDKVKLGVKVTDKDGNPIAGTFSLAVTDDKVVSPSAVAQNIMGTLLLDADLKGYIENPGWYFFGDEPERADALDNLLCTQGWTRYTWEDNKTQTRKSKTSDDIQYPIDLNFKISGRVTNVLGRPVKEGNVILSGTNHVAGHTTTDKDGRFVFEDIYCPDSSVFAIQGRTKSNSRDFLGVSIDKVDNRAPLTYIPMPEPKRVEEYISTITTRFLEQAVQQRKFVDNMWSIDLPDLEVKSTRLRKMDEDNMWDGIRSFKVKRDEINNYAQIKDEYPRLRSRYFTSIDKVILILNEMMVSDFTLVENDYMYMYNVEIVRGARAAIYGASGADGAILLNYRSNQDLIADGEFTTPGLTTYHPDGFTTLKEFYVPNYDDPEAKTNPTPDLRTTLYWNPLVKTDENGESELSFFTADNMTTFTCIMEGAANGQLGMTRLVR